MVDIIHEHLVETKGPMESEVALIRMEEVSFRGSDAKKINDAFSEAAMQVAMQRVYVPRVFGS